MSRSRLPTRLNASLRELILFFVGIAGVGYETLAEHADRPYLLALFGGMLGLPWIVDLDRRSQRRRKHHDEDDE